MKPHLTLLLLGLGACAGSESREERPFPDRVFSADETQVRTAVRDAMKQAIFPLEREEENLLAGALTEDAGFSWKVSVALFPESGAVTLRTTLEIVRDSNRQPIRSLFRNGAEAGLDDEAAKGASPSAVAKDRQEIESVRHEGVDDRERRVEIIQGRVERFLIDLDARLKPK